MKIKFIFLFLLWWLVGNSHVYADMKASTLLGIAPDRLVEIQVPCYTFSGATKNHCLQVLDVIADSVKKIFAELFKNNFPIYYTYIYQNRLITDGNTVSLHAYGAAIDINEYLNPYVKVTKNLSIDPQRYSNQIEDDKQLRNYLQRLRDNGVIIDVQEQQATLEAIMQKEGEVDWFLNREIKRKGMLGIKEAEIFARNGFMIWGGNWAEPIDYMHFQISINLAEHLATVSKEEGKNIWANHLTIIQWQFKLQEKLKKLDEKLREELQQDNYSQCQRSIDGEGEYYFAAAYCQDDTVRCVIDCQHKIDQIDLSKR